jgi:NAD-dependent DNA ligase
MTHPKPLAGLRIAIVGKFSVYHHVVAELIEEAGGTFVEFVDRSTSFLVSGEPSQEGGMKSAAHRAKLAVARQCDVKVLTEDEFSEMVRPYAEYDPEAQAAADAAKLQTHDNYGDW